VKDGIYQGTTIDGLQTGFGRMLFNDNVNYHPEIITKALNQDFNLNNHRFVFYEGGFEQGKLHGPGTLRL